ncbi:hypothetical protein ACFLWA_00755 [Chloroflexota bacterium]
MSGSHKIITKLHERRQIEARLRQMPASSSELEFRQQAQKIANQGSQVLPAIIGSLDRADSRLLMAMGAVCTFLDRDEVARALRRAVRQPQRTDEGRMAALTILTRFLGELPEDDLLDALNDPGDVALSALEDVLAQAERHPTVLVEYVQALDHEEPDDVLAVIDTLSVLGAQSVELLRMMAQDVREEIAAAALQTLGDMRRPEAARALQTLLLVTAPPLQRVAERLLRKLQFAGVSVEPLSLPGPESRALVGAVDGLGQRSLWFIQETPRAGQARFLNVLISDQAGAVEANGHAQVSTLVLPPRRPEGAVHDIALPDGSGAMLMLEAPFDLGRRLLIDALADNRETQIPVAGVLRWLGPWLWGYGIADTLPARRLPELAATDGALVDISDRLLAHPAFATWTLRTDDTLHIAGAVRRHPGWDRAVWVNRLADGLFSDPLVAQVLSQRLIATSELLLWAGEESLSRVALVVGQEMTKGKPEQLPFVRALIRRDIELSAHSLEKQPEPETGSEHRKKETT